MYIRKNHLTIGEDPEIYEIVSEDKTVHWSGTELELSRLLGDHEWRCNDTVSESLIVVQASEAQGCPETGSLT